LTPARAGLIEVTTRRATDTDRTDQGSGHLHGDAAGQHHDTVEQVRGINHVGAVLTQFGGR
jgi:hypothetical protein